MSNITGDLKDIIMLYSVEELKHDFAQLSELDIWDEEVVPEDGDLHSGKSTVIRLIGKK